MEFGTSVTLSELTEDNWDAAGRVGFEFTSRGEEGIAEGLELIYRRPLKNVSRLGPKGTFGNLYTWAQFRKNDKPVGPIKAVLRDFILDRFHVERGTNLLGGIVDQTLRHSVGSLSAKYGVHQKTTVHALRKSGLLPTVREDVDERRTVPAEPAEALFEQLARAIPVAKIPKYIGCSRSQASLLLESGILKPIIQDDGDTRGRHKGVDCHDLNRLIKAMRQTGRSVSEPSEGMLNIGDAAGTLTVPSMEILSLLLTGQLTKVELLPEELKLRSGFVHLEEVAKRLGVLSGKPGLTVC